MFVAVVCVRGEASCVMQEHGWGGWADIFTRLVKTYWILYLMFGLEGVGG